MSKGYLMANLRVDDPEIFKEFSSVALPLIEKYGGKLLARGPDADRHEGSVSGVVTLIEFESKTAAEKFYFSDEYRMNLQIICIVIYYKNQNLQLLWLILIVYHLKHLMWIN